MTASVAAGFGSCLLGLGLLVAWATDAAFEREERRAEASLEAAAGEQVADFTGLFDSAVPLISDLAADPGVASLDPAACGQALAPFASITAQARIVVVDATGGEVCALPADGSSSEVGADLYDEALTGAVDTTASAFIDPVSGHPAVATAVPVGDAAPSAAVVIVLYLDVPALSLSPGIDPATVIVATDPASGLVLATTPGAPYAPGEQVDWLSPPDTGADGVRRIWREGVEPATGWHLAAGLEVDAALAPARAQQRSLLLIGAAVQGLVVVLAVSLQRRLARPIKRLGAAIASSRAGQDEVRAPEVGPTEVVEVARAFNELVDSHQGLIQRLRRNARHDALTGLLNRRGATEELAPLLEDPAAEPLVVLFIDLDRFKLVNDSHGHAIGDELLVELAARIRAAVPDHWIVSRFGGDEFVIICPATPDPLPAVKRLGEVLRSTIRIANHDLRVGGSTGIARSRPGQSADDLLREADTAMYRAKELGRGGYAEFDEEMRAWTIERLTTEADLRAGLERDELRVHYQPVIDLRTGQTTGVEALVRWQHPTRGLLGPGAFISVAEESDLILSLGEQVATAAARQAASWRAAGTPATVSINVAAAQLVRTDLVAMLEDAITATGADPGDLVIEVTESSVLSDVEATVAQLGAIRRLGVRVALDDFGTGFSSLSYLQRLPADELKIDRSFVASIGIDPVSEAIISSVINLAHAVGLVVVAEGIETEEQLQVLRSLDCDMAQGFLLGRPSAATDLRLLAPALS